MLARHEQLALFSPGEHEQERAAVHAHRDAQHDAAAVRDDGASLLQRGAHAVRRATCPFGMKVAFEEQEQRVTAELHQIAAFGVSDSQERVERRVEDARELLSTSPTELSELLGESSEAGYVGKDHGAGRVPHRAILNAE